MPAEWRQVTKEGLARKFGYLAGQVAGRDHLLGARFTVADAYLFVVLSWLRYLEMDLAAWPALQAYQARVAARPAVQAAMKAEGLR